MAAATLVKGGIKLDVHVTSCFGGLFERVGLAVDCTTSLYYAFAAQRGYST
jgi:hypothetical protein